jgi:ABC-type Zn uptake system ZnuABC Zn-binding protein ZnuA
MKMKIVFIIWILWSNGLRIFLKLFVFASLLVVLVACNQGSNPPAPGQDQDGKLNVVATTTILGDVVTQVGGDAIDLVVLLPVGVDPHSFQPTPQDVARLADADLIFISGVGLESFMDSILQNTNSQARLVDSSEGIALVANEAPEGSEYSDEGQDPHVWMDPNNVLLWVDNIEKTLIELDPDKAEIYRANAEQYRVSLIELDQWVRQQVDQIPEPDRKLVTDHLVFDYFAERYGFEQVGAVVPGYSTLAEPSAQELATLEDTIRQSGVGAILVGDTVNPSLADRVARDTGIRLVVFYTGSLTAPGGAADNYLDYIRYNVGAILEALQ